MRNPGANPNLIHLTGLNGLRAIAALAVVISHITTGLDEFGLDPFIFGTIESEGTPRGLMLAGYGVSIFFALSGFLITYLLLREKEVKPINTKNFYIRRMLRIWPLYYLYLVITLVVIYAFTLPFNNASAFFYTFLLANIPFIIDTKLPMLAHYWSLGVEEQFYAFWPWLAKLRNNKLLRITFIATLVFLLVKIGFWALDKYYGFGLPLKILNVIRFDCMMLGAMGAIFYYNKNRVFMFIATHVVAQSLCWLAIFFVAINKFRIISFLDNEIISAVTVGLIIGQITQKNRILNLDNKVFDFLGKISYGIYVIHPLIQFMFYRTIGKFENPHVFNYISVYVLITLTTIFAAWLSYNFFEKRFLQLKSKYSTVESSGSKEPPVVYENPRPIQGVFQQSGQPG